MNNLFCRESLIKKRISKIKESDGCYVPVVFEKSFWLTKCLNDLPCSSDEQYFWWKETEHGLANNMFMVHQNFGQPKWVSC
ncbi:hypothetical protein MKX03_009481 [Papaver bracteatum]|nr:hypothetical protein MKX03_009481 [Papaver bracteatum]